MPEFDALIVSHGQPSAPDPAEAALAGFVGRVQQHCPDLRLGSATMAAPGRLEETLEQLAHNAPVYPMFMSDGWFVKTALAKRLDGAPVRVVTPLGLEPTLPELVVKAISGCDEVLLTAHGSANGRPAPERAARDFAGALKTALPRLNVTVGFLEQAPFIADVAKEMQGVGTPIFAMSGDHVRKDLPEELNKAKFTGPTLPVISDIPGTDAMVAASISRACTSPE